MSEQNQTPDKPPTERKETVPEMYMRLSLTNPTFKMAKPSGAGFVIGGQKPNPTE